MLALYPPSRTAASSVREPDDPEAIWAGFAGEMGCGGGLDDFLCFVPKRRFIHFIVEQRRVIGWAHSAHPRGHWCTVHDRLPLN